MLVFYTITAIIFAVMFVFLLSFQLSGFSIAPWVPSRKKDLARINRLAALKPGQIFVELGCGDGRVSRYMARNNPDSKIIGIEISAPIFLWAKMTGILFKPDNLTFKFGNAFNINLAEADVIYVYALVGTINNRLKEKFIKELKKDGKVLSYVFPIKEWAGEQSVDRPDKRSRPIYIYRC